MQDETFTSLIENILENSQSFVDNQILKNALHILSIFSQYEEENDWLLEIIPMLVWLLSEKLTDKLYSETLFILSNLSFHNKNAILETCLLNRLK